MADVIGSAEFELRARREQLKKDLNDAERDLKQFGDKAEAQANQSAGGISRATRMIGTAVAALTAVFAVGITGAFALGRASLKMAEDLSNSAQRIGIGTSALQEFQYVARKTGEDANSVGPALEAFTSKLAAAASGLSKADLKNFKALGLGPEQLKGMDDAEKALDEVIDRIGALKDESDRAAIAERLGLGPLVSALREGSDEVARLRDEARTLGFVMDEDLIRKGAAASEQMEDLSQIIGIQMAEAFINLSDEVLAFSGHIANALRGLNDFIEGAGRMRARVDAMYGEGFTSSVLKGDVWGATSRATSSLFSGKTGRAAESIRNGLDLVDASPVDRDALAALASPPRTPRSVPDYNSTLTIPPGRTRTDNSAQRAAEREARRAERVEQDIFRARQRLLLLAEDDILTAQQRFELAQDQLRLDRDARDAEIESKSARGEIKDAERRTLEAANAQADALEDRILTDNAFREIEDERLATERLMAGLAADLLSLQSGAARTAKERREIELELLEIAQRQRREALRVELDRNPTLTPAQRAEALATNGRIDAAENSAVLRSTMSPLEQWRDESLKTADEIAEAYENVAARGLDALNDGIVDAIMNSRNLGEVFHNVAQQILADLLAISVRRGITEPLANALFPQGDGGSGGGLGGLLSSLKGMFSGFRIPGFSSGVSNFSGGLAYVHQGEVLANLAPGTDVIPAHAVGGGKGPPLHFDLRGAVMTGDLLQQMERMAVETGGAALTGARNVVPADMAKTSRYSFR